MRKLIPLILMVLAVSLIAQEALILQRVYVAPAEVDSETEVPPLFLDSGTTLFTLINTRQPVIRSDEGQANSTIATRISRADEGVEIEFSLHRGDEVLLESRAVIPPNERNRSYAEFLNRSAAEFAPLLDRVPPEVRLQELTADQETRELLDELLFTESMITPFEASLWLGIVTKQPGDSSGSDPLYFHLFRNYFAELTWFPNPNHGISGTLFFEYSDFASHADSAAGSEDPGKSTNLYFLPGIGYTYRTLGRLSAGFFAGINAGALLIRADEDISYENGLNLQEGDSELVFFHMMAIKPFVSYALNESWSLKTSFALYIALLQEMIPVLGTDYYDSGDPWAEIQFLNVGVSYRW